VGGGRHHVGKIVGWQEAMRVIESGKEGNRLARGRAPSPARFAITRG